MSRPQRFFLLLVLAILVGVGGWQASAVGGAVSKAEASYPRDDALQVSSQQCLPNGTVRVNFVWTNYNGGPQWLDLSLSNNGFAVNTFYGLGPLASNQSQFTWDGLISGATHFMRANSLVNGQWYPSNTLAFFTSYCSPSSTSNAQGASNLTIVSLSCLDNGRVRLSTQWTSSNQGEQWQDLSLINNGWINGTFVSLGPISAGVSQQTWDGLLSNRQHYLRVNTNTAIGWLGSNTVSFTTPNCAPNTTPTPPVLSDFSTVAQSVSATTNNQVTLNNVQFATHPDLGYDSLIFTFDNGIPASTVQYVNAATACGSGNTVPLQGVAVLRAHFTSAVAHNNSGGVTVNATQVTGTPDAILEAKQICDFEGVVDWALGTDSIAPFKVSILQNPPRIEIDVKR